MSIPQFDPPNNSAPHSASPLLGLRDELAAIVARFEVADQQSKRAATIEDRAVAEWEKLAAASDFTLLGMALADFLLMLFRLALRYQPAALADYLARALKGVFEKFAEAVATGEIRK